MRQVRPSGDTPHGGKGCGFCPAYGAAQHADMWELRLNENLRTAYASIYGCTVEELAVSADNVFFLGTDGHRDRRPTASALSHRNASKAVRAATGSSLSLHKDVGAQDTFGVRFEALLAARNLNYTRSVQGQILLTCVDEHRAGLVLVEGDMDFALDDQQRFFSNVDTDFCTCTDAAYEAFRHRLIKPCVPEGTALLWRSDRVHANCKADAGTDPTRAGIFVTWHPRVCAYDADLKMQFICQGRTGTHWPLLLQRWRAAGSHFSNKNGESKAIRPTFSEALRARILAAV